MPVRCHSTSRPSSRDLVLHAVEILHAHRGESVNLVGPPRLSILESVGQTGVDESAVATRRGPADSIGLDQHDAPVRMAPCGVQCGPQSRVTATDDQQIAGDGRGRRGYSGRSISSHIDPKVLAASERSISAGSTSPSNTVFHRRTLRRGLGVRQPFRAGSERRHGFAAAALPKRG